MADFCRQCTKDILGIDENLNDMRGATTQQDMDDGLAAVVLCESCGPIQVDPTGACLTHQDHEKEIE